MIVAGSDVDGDESDGDVKKYRDRTVSLFQADQCNDHCAGTIGEDTTCTRTQR